MKHRTSLLSLLPLLLMAAATEAQGQTPLHLKRSADTLEAVEMAISTETAHYKPLFGAGASDAEVPLGVTRYGQLIVESEGRSQSVTREGEELVYYVLGGTGLLRYGDQEVPISRDDFFYVPPGTAHRFSNPREDTLEVMTMGFSVPEGPAGAASAELKIANASDVPFQVLGSHGGTVTYRLLMGTTESERDRLAAAERMTSLYVMDFKPGGTNKPHRHGQAEEIYFLLQGHGEMVAGAPDGTSERYPAEAGDAFFFTPGSPVGFYSGNEEGEPHARILAVRSTAPGTEEE